jgi:hypothetical protein
MAYTSSVSFNDLAGTSDFLFLLIGDNTGGANNHESVTLLQGNAEYSCYYTTYHYRDA